jgi:hypothetical protein
VINSFARMRLACSTARLVRNRTEAHFPHIGHRLSPAFRLVGQRAAGEQRQPRHPRVEKRGRKSSREALPFGNRDLAKALRPSLTAFSTLLLSPSARTTSFGLHFDFFDCSLAMNKGLWSFLLCAYDTLSAAGGTEWLDSHDPGERLTNVTET